MSGGCVKTETESQMCVLVEREREREGGREREREREGEGERERDDSDGRDICSCGHNNKTPSRSPSIYPDRYWVAVHCVHVFVCLIVSVRVYVLFVVCQ